MNNILTCNDLKKSYKQGANVLHVLNGVSLEVAASETISIVGSSGSGKSTLLHLLAGLDKVTSGSVSINNQQLNKLRDSQVCTLRNQYLGFVYQFHHLLAEFTALENILMPIMISGNNNKMAREFAHTLLNKLKISKRAQHYPSQLSGGERQRVAIARAVINSPKIIFADEPTGNLDNNTANEVLDLFFMLQEELNTSLIIVTHDDTIAARTQKQYRLHNGLLT